MIRKIKEFLKLNNLDGYLIPKNDIYFTEYSKVNNLEKVTNFTGSAGFALILKKKITYMLMGDIHFKQSNRQAKILLFATYQKNGQKIYNLQKVIKSVSIQNCLLKIYYANTLQIKLI